MPKIVLLINYWGAKIFSGLEEEVDFVMFVSFSNGGHLRYLTCTNFTILRPWCQVMVQVKFEN